MPGTAHTHGTVLPSVQKKAVVMALKIKEGVVSSAARQNIAKRLHFIPCLC